MEVISPEEIKTAIEEQVKPEPEEVTRKELAANNVQAIMELDIESLEKRRQVQSIESFGIGTMRSSSEKNALLQVQVGRLSKPGMKAVKWLKG